jgi:hypothetical protein
MIPDERTHHDFDRDDDQPKTCRFCGQDERSPIHTDRKYEAPKFSDISRRRES